MGALVEAEALTPGPPGQGSLFHDVFEDHGRRVELDAEVTRYEPQELVEIRLSSDSFEGTSRQRLEERDGGRTLLTATIDTEYKRGTARLLAPVITRYAQKQLEADLVALKRLVESS